MVGFDSSSLIFGSCWLKFNHLISWLMLNDDYRQQTIKLFPKLPNIRNRPPSYNHSCTHQDHLASSQKLVGGSMLRLFP